MTHEQALERLDDYVDGSLAQELRGEVEAHLKECVACRRETERLEALLADARALPPSIEPSRDLWPSIEDRLDVPGVTVALRGHDGAETAEALDAERGEAPGRGLPQPPMRERTLWSVRYRLAAAAGLLIVLSSGITSLVLSRRTPALPPEGGRALSAIPASAVVERWPALESGYLLATSELRAALETVKGRLAPETVGIVEKNLGIIDGAIVEAREALAADPGNPEMIRMLAAMYEKKIDVLRQVTGFQAGI